jgi:glycosyltransferase involved in cell wall biosynthesis
MGQPRVSIVIPTFNRANLVRRAIDSALAQTVPCEVVVCDHGSTDSTPEVARSYGERIRYIRRETDQGPIACWRDGIENATGELVHINYDDDWIDPRFAERTAPLMGADVAFVYTRVLLHFQGSSVTGGLLAHPVGKRPVEEIARHLLRSRLTISPGCALFRRSDLLENLLPEVPGADGVYGKGTGVGEDLLVFLLTTLQYPSYVHLPEPLSHFLAHPSSITVNAKIRGRNRALREAYAHAKRYYLSRPGSVSLRSDLSWRLKWWFESGILNHLKSGISLVSRRIQFLVFQLRRGRAS